MRLSKAILCLGLVGLLLLTAVRIHAQATDQVDRPFTLFLPLISSDNNGGVSVADEPVSDAPLATEETFVEAESSAEDTVNSAAATAYYVATTGNDANPGTLSAPWRTIQKAANTVPAGSTVNIRNGVYNEAVKVNVSGSASGGYITFQSAAGETATIDGTGLTVPDANNGLLLIQGRSYLIFKNLVLRNYRSSQANRYPIGIFILGASHHIELRNNLISNIETNYPGPFTSTKGAGAQGTLVLGDSATTAISNLVIDGNELRNLKLGWSESLTLNGNVDGFTITNNQIHDTNNIGIDISGGYDYVKVPKNVNTARNGVIRSNHIYNITSNGNPAYGNGVFAADGIYVDGGSAVTIEQNRIHHVDIGIELAAENAGWATSGVIARNNFVYFNNSTGMAIGGYDKKRGYTEKCIIVNNTFFRNNQRSEGTGELYIQYDTRNNTIQNNIFFAGSDDVLIWNDYTANTGNSIDYNIYFAPGGANGSTWRWKAISYTSFSAYQTKTGNDSHSRFIDPQLSNLTTLDLHLRATSPAINKGNSNANAGSYDYDGQLRRQGGAIDIGADEAL